MPEPSGLSPRRALKDKGVGPSRKGIKRSSPVAATAANPEGIFFAVEPEVVGASRTGSAASPVFIFDTWLGDELVRVQPYFLAVARLRTALEAIRPQGLRFEKVAVRSSPYFRRYARGVRIPRFWRLILEGRPGRDDAGLTPGSVLVVSRPVFDVLVRFQIPRAVFSQHPAGEPASGQGVARVSGRAS